MGTIKKGILGGFSGKVGNVVGASWKGVQYIRSLPSSVGNPKTAKQREQRTRFSLIAKFVRSILPVIQVGFESLAGATNSAYGAAVSYNIHHATKGEYPDVEIDFPNAVIAKGALYGTDEMTVTREPGSLKMEWDPEASNNSSDTDGLMMVAYNPTRQKAIFDMNAATRAEGSGLLKLPSAWDDEDVETFALFVDEYGKQVSDSIYTGKHEVNAGG